MKDLKARPGVHIFESKEQLFDETAQFILSLACEGSRFTLSLSGGSTPQGLYERMAAPDFRQHFPWDRMHFFWGDERWVPPSDSRSNFRMVREALLDPAKIPAGNIHGVPIALSSPVETAAAYEKKMRSFFGVKDGTLPVFDLVLLGLGEDGHTASLFPGDPALQETQKLVTTGKLGGPEPRITLTYPVLNNAKNIIFLVAGEGKKKILKEILEPSPSTPDYPARKIRASSGRLFWFLDRSAASPLS